MTRSANPATTYSSSPSMPLSPPPGPAPTATPGRLVDAEGARLPLVAVSATCQAAAGLARVVLRQRFANDSDVPLEVIYSLPLPSEAAVSGFAFTLGERRVVGEIDRREQARARYETALATGHTASLLEQDRDSLFTQSLGNVPPRTAIDAEITLDLRLRYEGGAWELRLPTTVAPRYLGVSGRVEDAARVAQDVAASAMPLRFTLAATIGEAIVGSVESPSHALTTSRSLTGTTLAFAAEGGVPLDRDVVLRWRTATETARPVVTTGTGPTGALFGVFAITPPARPTQAVPRDLVLLLDTSGSMGGMPIEQAKRVAAALVMGLGEADSLEMIAFSSSPSRWKRGATRMNAKGRDEALRWLSSLYASGGTEMRDAILEALRPLRVGAQRQVVLVSDGLIGFEEEIVTAIREGLPAGSRVHTVGVGSSVNRTLTRGAARAGRGTEVLADLTEDPERVAARLLPRVAAPVVTNVVARGDALLRVAPSKLPDVYAGAPLVFAAELNQAGGTISLSGDTAAGPWSVTVPVAPPHEGSGLGACEQLYARELADDLELRAACGESVDAELEAVGLMHRILTRRTSWVAITQEVTTDDGAPFDRVRMPHELPFGTSAEAFGLRPAAVLPSLAGAAGPGAERARHARAPAAFGGAPPMPAAAAPPPTGAPPAPKAVAPARSLLRRAVDTVFGDAKSKKEAEAEAKGGAPTADMTPPAEESFAVAPSAARDDDDVRTLVREPLREKRDETATRGGGGGGEPHQLVEDAGAPLEARIVVQQGRRLTVLVTTVAELDLGALLSGPLVLTLADGSRVAITLVTRAGRVAAGQSVRLTFETLEGDASVTGALTIEINGVVIMALVA